MTNLLKIFHIPGKISLQDFKPWFIDATKRVFYEKSKERSEMVPMVFLLTPAGVLGVYPNFEDEKKKSISMQQLKILARTSQATAYGLVGEMFMKSFSKSKNELNQEFEFLQDLNYQVSLLPDRVEGLICFVEVKTTEKISRSCCAWEIVTNDKGRRSLKNFRDMEPDSFEGRMTGILI